MTGKRNRVVTHDSSLRREYWGCHIPTGTRLGSLASDICCVDLQQAKRTAPANPPPPLHRDLQWAQGCASNPSSPAFVCVVVVCSYLLLFFFSWQNQMLAFFAPRRLVEAFGISAQCTSRERSYKQKNPTPKSFFMKLIGVFATVPKPVYFGAFSSYLWRKSPNLTEKVAASEDPLHDSRRSPALWDGCPPGRESTPGVVKTSGRSVCTCNCPPRMKMWYPLLPRKGFRPGVYW